MIQVYLDHWFLSQKVPNISLGARCKQKKAFNNLLVSFDLTSSVIKLHSSCADSDDNRFVFPWLEEAFNLALLCYPTCVEKLKVTQPEYVKTSFDLMV